MKLLYLSAHSILEHDELTLFTELNIDCFSHGAYSDPAGHKSLPRPGIKGMKPNPDFETLARKHPKTNLPKELIDWADVIYIMHTPEWVVENWERIKHKRVVWRSIGQSTPPVENMIRRMRYEGMKIVRYSPMERNIPGYLGEDALIRFYKDPAEFCEWTGKVKKVVNFTQSLKSRRDFCHYDVLMQIMNGFPGVVYGPGNDDLGPLNGGDLTYDDMKGQLRENRAFLYVGTWPACYTLSFVEAWMTGIPIVSIGRELAEELSVIPQTSRLFYFEVPNLIAPGDNGFVSDNKDQLRTWIHELFENDALAKRIGENGRAKAMELFGKAVIKPQWAEFFKTL